MVSPGNVLFEGSLGETIQMKRLHDCDVHTLLLLPTAQYRGQGVKSKDL